MDEVMCIIVNWLQMRLWRRGARGGEDSEEKHDGRQVRLDSLQSSDQ